jgi:hypothetical protein
MKRLSVLRVASFFLAMALFVVFTMPAAAQNHPTLVKQKLQKMYMEHLSSAGYRPIVDEDGDIQFKREGLFYCIFVEDSDTVFFRLVLFQTVDDMYSLSKILEAANFANTKAKVFKISTAKNSKGENRVFGSVELLLSNPSDFKDVLDRAFNIIDTGMALFKIKLFE